jgi:hypothetical protein
MYSNPVIAKVEDNKEIFHLSTTGLQEHGRPWVEIYIQSGMIPWCS